MVRKRVTQNPASRQKEVRTIRPQREVPSATANTQMIRSDQATAAGRIEARLKTAAKEAFQKMGED